MTRASTACTPNGANCRPKPRNASPRPAAPVAASWRSARPVCDCSKSAAAETGEVRPFAGETRLFILPGYRFRAIDVLLTNFHLPRSTLFMLVAP